MRALLDGVTAQLFKMGFIARGGQIIDATLVPAPKQHLDKVLDAHNTSRDVHADWGYPFPQREG